jgi:hypothetical protein
MGITMTNVLVIYYRDNGEEDHHSDYYRSWEENELFELPDDADPDVFVGILRTDIKKKYGKSTVLSAYVVSRIID